MFQRGGRDAPFPYNPPDAQPAPPGSTFPMSAPPFAPASVSLRVYPAEHDALRIVEEMREQARLAEAVGFDGLMTAEHHGGFPGYIPNPLQMAGWLLEADSRRAICPIRTFSQARRFQWWWPNTRWSGR